MPRSRWPTRTGWWRSRKNWLDQYLGHKQNKSYVKGQNLFGVRRTQDLAASKLRECSTVASRHGLSLIFKGGRIGKAQPSNVEKFTDEARPALDINR
jgi:hypothetical protein